jgi:phosphatidylglycerophosphatase GEP4
LRIEKDRREERLRERYSIDGRGPLAVWTVGVWKREGMSMRWFERKVVDAVERWSVPREDEVRDTSRFVRRVKIEERKPSILMRLWSKIMTA